MEHPSLRRHHRDVPLHLKILCLYSLLNSAIAGICEHISLLAVKKILSLSDVVRVGVGRCRQPDVGQARLSIDADVRLHPQIVLIVFLGLMHLWGARATVVSGRTARLNQRRVDRCTVLEQQSLRSERYVDFGQDDLNQTKLLEKLAKPHNGGFFRQARGSCIQTNEPALNRHVVQCLFHRRNRVVVQQRKEVNPQHLFN